MREIKFRVWDKILKRMLSWEWVHDNFFSRIFDYPNMIPVQFTGLKDKNGKEIYEGDIVRHPIYSKNLSIIWHDGKYVSMFVASYDGKHGLETIALTVCEVIGNIYENPELLELGSPHDQII